MNIFIMCEQNFKNWNIFGNSQKNVGICEQKYYAIFFKTISDFFEKNKIVKEKKSRKKDK